MRAFAIVAATTVLLAGPAYAQSTQSQPAAKTPMQLIDEQKEREKADIERQYDQRQKRPDADVKSDPWRTMRSVDSPTPKR
jgi:gas vesicle protein